MAIKKAKKNIKRLRKEKEENNLKEKREELILGIFELMDVFEIVDEQGRELTKEDIYKLSPEEMIEVMESTLKEAEKIVL